MARKNKTQPVETMNEAGVIHTRQMPVAEQPAAPEAPAANEYAKKRTPCTVTRAQFRAQAKPLAVKVGEQTMIAAAKEFSTGSLGWNVNEKLTLTLADGTPVTVQVGMNLTIVNSKEAVEG